MHNICLSCCSVQLFILPCGFIITLCFYRSADFVLYHTMFTCLLHFTTVPRAQYSVPLCMFPLIFYLFGRSLHPTWLKFELSRLFLLITVSDCRTTTSIAFVHIIQYIKSATRCLICICISNISHICVPI